jgi:hypothetical protein
MGDTQWSCILLANGNAIKVAPCKCATENVQSYILKIKEDAFAFNIIE